MSALPFVGAVMSGARDLVFFFNGVELTGERVENVPAEFPVPVKAVRCAAAEKSGRWWKFGKQKRLPLQGTWSIATSLAMSLTLARSRFRPDINIPHIFYS